MKIKRLDIVGFKSFVDRMTFEFPEGVVGIVGPNGCGKSNIVDAICWVMGEQNARKLRGRVMEDIIFGGSESRKPLGLAEVSLTFSNEDGLAPAAFRDYAEIVVTRRLYRNGDSEYLINKTACRLLDITELFMDTGVGAKAYSIIEQGRIGMVLNSKPEERRFLIEEAAGVTKFKSRKKSALRKIEATRHNLERLNDIISEVRRQTANLKRQARKAERFRELRDELRTIELRLASERYREMLGNFEERASQERGLQVQAEGKSAALAEQETVLEQTRLEQSVHEREVAEVQEQVYRLTAELQKIESTIAGNDKEMELLIRQKERQATDMGEVAARLEQLNQEEAAVQLGLGAFRDELAAEERRQLAAELVLTEVAENEAERSRQLETVRNALYQMLGEMTRYSAQKDEATRRLQTLDQLTEKNHAEVIQLRHGHEEAQRQGEVLSSALQQIRGNRDTLEQRRSALDLRRQELSDFSEENEAQLLERREELNRHGARLESLRQIEKSLEGYGGGVRELLGDERFGQRFVGVLADRLDVPARLEAAVEAVLGDRLQGLLALPAVARDAMTFLQQKQARCTFVLPGFSSLPIASLPGTPLLELIRVRDDAPIVQALLCGVALVDDLAPYLDGGVPVGATLVTEAGETLTARGELTGGAGDALEHGLLHKKREIKELDGMVATLTTTVSALQAQREELRTVLTATVDEQRQVEADLHQNALQAVDREKDLAGRLQEAERFRDRLEVLSLEESQLHEEHEELRRLLSDSAQLLDERLAQKVGQESEVQQLQVTLQELRQAREAAAAEVTTLKVSVASYREREEGGRQSLARFAQMRQDLQSRSASLQQQQVEAEASCQRLQKENERHRVELALLFERRGTLSDRVNALRDIFETGRGKIDQLDVVLKELRSEVTRLNGALAEVQLAGRELRLEAEHLCESMLERHRVDLRDYKPPSDSWDRGGSSTRISSLRSQIEAMGEVNLTAIEEFQELEQRLTFLVAQQDDLQRSLAGLQAAISKINKTTRRRFRETFDLVNIKFQELFPRLFRGGKAILRLTDEDDLLETGIEIDAQPPGKKLQNVTLLSGGEKALTAVALIFSIFMIKPSPFCLLDEVDAPLDDANIGRFNELVREMSAISQFILITHNKRTMEIADMLYGVTMEEPGVSKTVSVRLNEY
jgi:chromosome segregation protein